MRTEGRPFKSSHRGYQVHVVPGGIVICAGIHMSDVSSFPYRLLQLYDLADSNRALADLRGGRFHDAAVVKL